MVNFLSITLAMIKPTLRRGNLIGLLGCLLIFVSGWLDADKHSGSRTLLIIGCIFCGLGLLNHLIWLFTKEARESIWTKGSLFSAAITPARWRGLHIGLLGVIIAFLGGGLYDLEICQASYLSVLGWAVGMLGMVNHWRWFWTPGSSNPDS
jgi:hypothetical protein